MPGDLTPSEIRGHGFTSSRRGYDRAEVERFLQRVADEVADLQARLTQVTDRMGQLGIDELPDAKVEFENVSSDIASMLEEARSAARGMRERAHTDAAERTAAAMKDAKALRSDAWEAGTELLQQALAEGERLVAAAKEDALFIRAEAEQDALRLVTDSRRQADELVRSARQDAERSRVDAHADSAAILEEARRAAEQAQERTRALESRRSELLDELEQARSAIGEIEAERTGRPLDAGSSESSVRVIADPNHAATHWPEDGGAVRIVPSAASERGSDDVVDAEAMAAEVEQMRAAVLPQRAREVEPEVAEPEPEPGPEPEPELEQLPDTESAPETEDGAGSARSIEPDAPQVAPEPSDRPERPDGVHTEPQPPAAEPPPMADASEAPAVEEAAAPGPGLDELFAKLRRPEAVPDAAEDETTGELSTPEPSAEPEPVVVPVASSRFEQRDRLLLPVENRALRGLKRGIVELQNLVLDGLRTGGGDWGLGRELVATTLGTDLDSMIQEAFLAGYVAVAEELDREAPAVTGGPAQGAAEEFTADLHQAVQAVLVRGRGDSGSRRLASDVGRVFRSWRTDDAERHVRLAARRAFHDGLLAAYHRFGVAAVELVAPGRPCGECGAGTGIRWDPGEVPPDGILIPPAGRSCDAIVVPVSPNGS